MKFKQKTLGFTLIELLLLTALIASLSVMSAPFFARFLNQNSVENATQQFLGSFHKAQMYAISGKQNDNWGVHYATNTITLYKGATFASRTVAFDETFSVPAGTTVSSFSDVNFTRATGIPDAAKTITISAPGNNSNVVTINAQGVATR